MAERAAPPHVLYIDDDPGIARLVQRHLQRAGYRVTLAGNGEDGVALAASQRFDAIGLDHYMPGQDGLEVLQALSGIEGCPPVIFVTGAEEPRIAVTALKNGAADYVIKDTARHLHRAPGRQRRPGDHPGQPAAGARRRRAGGA